jgi:hypothetical protein
VRDNGRGKDSEVSNSLGDDVLEAPDKVMHLLDAQKACWSYGTVGAGADLARTVWPKQQFLFSSQQRSLVEAEGFAAHELVPPNRVPKTILLQHPVDCLLIDNCSTEVWTPWMSSALTSQQPEAILFFTQAFHLERETGAASKAHGKLMEKCGCSVQFWLMEACEFGAAVAQLRLGILCTQESSEGSLGPTPPVPDGLPVRPMSNLLMPFGVPTAACTKMEPNLPENPRQSFPCVSNQNFGWSPTFDPPRPHAGCFGELDPSTQRNAPFASGGVGKGQRSPQGMATDVSEEKNRLANHGRTGHSGSFVDRGDGPSWTLDVIPVSSRVPKQ